MSYDDGDLDEDDLYDRADQQRAERKEQDAADHFENARQDQAELAAGILPIPKGRHALIIEANGFVYIAPHLWEVNGHCLKIAQAVDAFLAGGLADGSGAAHAPGRYAIGLADDGNLDLGGRLPDA